MEGFVQRGGWGRRPGATPYAGEARGKPSEDGLACGPNRAPLHR